MNKFFSRSLMMLAALAMAMPMVGCNPTEVVVGEEMRNADFKEGGEQVDTHLGEELGVKVPPGAQIVN